MLTPARAACKSAGRYDTPPALAALVVGLGLEPLLEAAGRDVDPAAALLRLRVCDPACGEGNLLLEAARRIAWSLASARVAVPSPDDLTAALRDVVRRCIYGVERDPRVASRCRRALATEAGLRVVPGTLRGHVLAADVIELAGDGRWPRAFVEVTARGGFDAVLGNPPFLNAIEKREATADRARLRRLHPEVGATADVAFHFLALADALRRPRGRASMVLPRALLSAPSAGALRARLAPSLRAMYAPEAPRLFDGAQVFVCVVALGPSGPCRASRDDDPSGVGWRDATIIGDAWWAALLAACEDGHHAPAPRGGPSVGERFEVRASMTTAEAYAALPHLVDGLAQPGMALVTTGLIDRDVCHWGTRACRYLGSTLLHPRLGNSPALPATLARRLERARRPKVIVAGLGREIECFVDARGDFVGAVSTWTITHPGDDLGALYALARALHSAAADARMQRQLGATALAGGSVTVTRRFLDGVPLPEVCDREDA